VSVDVSRQTYPFSLPELPYAYDALEPHVDQQTLRTHHREHHATYVKKLNEALAKETAFHSTTLNDLLLNSNKLPEATRLAVRNNGGGHYNHDFFWNSMSPGVAREPGGMLADGIGAAFGSFSGFRQKFSEAAEKHFASGWIALAFDPKSRELQISHLKDHETLLPRGHVGLLILDVWEHAYYLKYQNRRPEFIEAFWNVVDWTYAEERFGGRQPRVGDSGWRDAPRM
jgi:superoxide dismutase, Fe-Mn family